ncbi:hypothetical protein [Streptomyces sp. Tu 6176]|uniref:hypothetical protein n=1 Tax=Streptomyces sp. Tu 6176 TaxID=1470557 RepID=UPI000683EAA0|nr:hypothetical protein [Streptomyces sp. Tu 6176]
MTLERLRSLVQERDAAHPDPLDPEALAAGTALPEATVRTLLDGGEPPADTVNERVRTRIKALADARLQRTGTRMSDLAGDISRQLGVSAFWARQVCSGEKVPSVELLHGLVGFFGVEGGEAFFTAPAPEALNRALLPVLTALRPARSAAGPSADPSVDPLSDPPAGALSRYGDVRGVALRQAHGLPPERWHVLNATLKALLELDDAEGQR